jgi:hypothetical protein
MQTPHQTERPSKLCASSVYRGVAHGKERVAAGLDRIVEMAKTRKATTTTKAIKTAKIAETAKTVATRDGWRSVPTPLAPP